MIRHGGLPIWLPWITLAVVVGAIVVDQLWPRDRASGVPGFQDMASLTPMLPPPAPAGAPDPSSLVAFDPVCSMTVRKAVSHSFDLRGTTWYFCTEYCRKEFAEDPAKWTKPPVNPSVGEAFVPTHHTMRGLPTWMFQVGVAVLLLISFGLFEIRCGVPTAIVGTGMDARWSLFSMAWVCSAVKWPPFRFVLTSITAALFLLIIAAGLFGSQNPAANIAPTLTWTVWWAGLIFLVLYFGKVWCTMCPWDAIAGWAERLKFWGRQREGLGLGLKWPRAWRNIWSAVAFFVFLTWLELGMSITLIPRATAWVALMILGLAIASAFIFERKSFCRYGCLVGRISGLYAMFGGVELRAKDPEACASCRTMDCYRGNEKGDGCPTFEFARTMKQSTYCTLCTECVRTCPKDNIDIRMRPWGADLAGVPKPRTDEAFLALILLALTGFHGLTMTPKWTDWNAWLQTGLSMAPSLSFTVLMAVVVVIPILAFWWLAKLSAVAARPHNAKAIFLHYAYALLPIALFYHLAHNAEHFFMEGPKIIVLASDPLGWGWNLFGTATWHVPPLVTLGGLWWLQVFFVIVGHVYGLWISARITRKILPSRRTGFIAQLPMVTAMVLFSTFSLWLLHQPMEMRISAM